jgi:hypothetical protein
MLVRSLTRETLGTDHPAYSVANEETLKVFPEIATINSTMLSRDYEIVKEFDMGNVTYIN